MVKWEITSHEIVLEHPMRSNQHLQLYEYALEIFGIFLVNILWKIIPNLRMMEQLDLSFLPTTNYSKSRQMAFHLLVSSSRSMSLYQAPTSLFQVHP